MGRSRKLGKCSRTCRLCTSRRGTINEGGHRMAWSSWRREESYGAQTEMAASARTGDRTGRARGRRAVRGADGRAGWIPRGARGELAPPRCARLVNLRRDGARRARPTPCRPARGARRRPRRGRDPDVVGLRSGDRGKRHARRRRRCPRRLLQPLHAQRRHRQAGRMAQGQRSRRRRRNGSVATSRRAVGRGHGGVSLPDARAARASVRDGRLQPLPDLGRGPSPSSPATHRRSGSRSW